MSQVAVRNPQAEATSLLPFGHEARVLEPSPPATTDPAWYADDPTDPGGADGTIVTPIDGEGVAWDEVVTERPELAGYASDHWLGAHRRLEPLPAGHDSTRTALHQFAFYALAPKRHAATGKLGLRYTHGGFGTPFYDDDEQVRVEEGLLVRQHGDQVSSVPLTTLEEACEFLDISYREVWFDDFHDPLSPVDPKTRLEIDPVATGAIGDWFGFTTLILELTRRTPEAEDVTRVQVWPEHFDPALEMGSNEKGQRASYGASPGDEDHPEPYLYVAPWGEIDKADPYWNGTSFSGSLLSYRELVDSEDQKQTAIEFYRQGYEKLTG